MWVRRAAAGDQAAFAVLVERYQDMAVGYARTLLGDAQTAEDAAQEAFIEAYRDLAQLREPRAFAGWLRRIVFKRCNRRTRVNRPPLVPLEEAYGLAALGPDPEAAALAGERSADVRAALSALPVAQRQVIVLAYFADRSYAEIGRFLELPVSTVKKRLHDARVRLKERLNDMAQQELTADRPSRDATFARTVEFFIALYAGDAERVGRLLDVEPALLSAQSDATLAAGAPNLPRGMTPLSLAVALGDAGMVKLLLARGADAGAAAPGGFTVLHVAALADRAELIPALAAAGAPVEARTTLGFTPLHLAAMRGRSEVTRRLVALGADPEPRDARGRTPQEWVELSGAGVGAGIDAGIDARAGTGAGDGADSGADSVAGPPNSPALSVDTHGPCARNSPAIPARLVTGIKIVDLFAPLPRGGRIGLFTPVPGIGKQVLLGQIIRNLTVAQGVAVVYAGLEHGLHTEAALRSAWRTEFALTERALAEQLTHMFGSAAARTVERKRLVEQAVAAAQRLQDEDREVLLVLESALARTEGVSERFPSGRATGEGARITTLIHGAESPWALPAGFGEFDACIAFAQSRAAERLFPAVDPVHSTSAWLGSGELSEADAGAIVTARRLLALERELSPVAGERGADALAHLEDPTEAALQLARGRRLQRFLTQPFYGAEPYTGIPGVWVEPALALAGLQTILAGACDDLPEERLAYIGALG